MIEDGRACLALTTLSWQGPLDLRSCQGLRGYGDDRHREPHQASAITERGNYETIGKASRLYTKEIRMIEMIEMIKHDHLVHPNCSL
jgi:hypothetical protein